MKKTTLFSLLLLFITSTLFAQISNTSQVIISGKIVDTKTNQPLEYATVILKDVKTKQLSGGITDEKGNFSINTPKGTYDVSFEYISFKTVTMPNKLIDKSINFGVIKLAED